MESVIDLTSHTQPHKVNVTAPARSPVGKRRSITATVPDPDNPTSLPSCVRGSYYAIHVRGYAVLPGVDVRRHARSHPDRVIKLLSPNTGPLAEHGVTAAAAAAASTCRASPPPPPTVARRRRGGARRYFNQAARCDPRSVRTARRDTVIRHREFSV